MAKKSCKLYNIQNFAQFFQRSFAVLVVLFLIACSVLDFYQNYLIFKHLCRIFLTSSLSRSRKVRAVVGMLNRKLVDRHKNRGLLVFC